MSSHSTHAYDEDGTPIGPFDGRYVRDQVGRILYWIDDGEVFSVPQDVDEADFRTHGAIKLADLRDGAAETTDGTLIFTLTPTASR